MTTKFHKTTPPATLIAPRCPGVARIVPWLLSAVVLLPAALAVPAAARDCSVAGAPKADVIGDVPAAPPSPEQEFATFMRVEAERYGTMRQLHDEATLDALDAAVVEPLPFIVGDLLYGPSQQAAGTDPGAGIVLEVAEEVAKEALDAKILATTLRFAQGSAPTLRTLAYLREVSSHKDLWQFSITVEALTQCGTSLGNAQGWLTIKDDWGSDQSGLHALDLPLKQVTTEIQDIEILAVKLKVSWCKSGWYTGKNKGCAWEPEGGNIKVEYA